MAKPRGLPCCFLCGCLGPGYAAKQHARTQSRGPPVLVLSDAPPPEHTTRMAIEFEDEDLLLVLDSAMDIARIDAPLPKVWLQRVARLGNHEWSKTYVAALGAALLARSTNDQVDCLTHKSDQGPRSYQLRKLAEFLARENRGRYHLGSTSEKNPVNASTLIKSNQRLDEFTHIKSTAKPAYDLFIDCLTTLNGHSSEEALLAFAAYLRLRMEVAQSAEEAARQLLASDELLSLEALLKAADFFVREDPEGGKRGQAFVAALLDCLFDDVELQKINSPHPGDVRIVRDGNVSLAVEVKQVAVAETTGINLAREARAMGADAALLVVICDKQKPLNREPIMRTATQVHGVAVAVSESVYELVHQLSVFGGGVTADIREQLPRKYLLRLIEHDVSKSGLQRWRDLMETRGAETTSLDEGE